MEKDFTKYDPKELVGKQVLHSYGLTYKKKLSRVIRTIVKVTPGGHIKISKSDIAFKQDGYARGLNSKMDMATVSKIELISDEERKILVAEFKENNEKIEILILLQPIVLEELSLKQLCSIKEILKL